jgi:hypothetical protein
MNSNSSPTTSTSTPTDSRTHRIVAFVCIAFAAFTLLFFAFGFYSSSVSSNADRFADCVEANLHSSVTVRCH